MISNYSTVKSQVIALAKAIDGLHERLVNLEQSLAPKKEKRRIKITVENGDLDWRSKFTADSRGKCAPVEIAGARWRIENVFADGLDRATYELREL